MSEPETAAELREAWPKAVSAQSSLGDVLFVWRRRLRRPHA